MKMKNVKKLDNGIYTLYWKSGGRSLAAVGMMPDGRKWMAPTNWVNGSTTDRKCWQMVRRAEQIL